MDACVAPFLSIKKVICVCTLSRWKGGRGVQCAAGSVFALAWLWLFALAWLWLFALACQTGAAVPGIWHQHYFIVFLYIHNIHIYIYVYILKKLQKYIYSAIKIYIYIYIYICLYIGRHIQHSGYLRILYVSTT